MTKHGTANFKLDCTTQACTARGQAVCNNLWHWLRNYLVEVWWCERNRHNDNIVKRGVGPLEQTVWWLQATVVCSLVVNNKNCDASADTLFIQAGRRLPPTANNENCDVLADEFRSKYVALRPQKRDGVLRSIVLANDGHFNASADTEIRWTTQHCSG